MFRLLKYITSLAVYYLDLDASLANMALLWLFMHLSSKPCDKYV